MKSLFLASFAHGLLALLMCGAGGTAAEPPRALRPWLETPQDWRRDTPGPIVSLGPAGAFDDTHIFAPMVARENDRYQLWYCGSRGTVQRRVFQLGLAASSDGRGFHKAAGNPVYAYGDDKHSILTPTLLRRPDGTTLREQGKLRMWFSSTWFAGPSALHTLHEATSQDGLSWSKPSPALLKHVYAPTVIMDDGAYRMWYIDVANDPWIIRHASSRDGREWKVTPEACLVVDQAWESERLFYPTVVKLDGVYLMWYGSYWKARKSATALGFAASLDGLTWRKHALNPVFRPDEKRPWESNYVTSQSVMRLPDGSLRMWYASRKKPPFVNKYFAINTAVWKTPGPAAKARRDASAPPR